MICVKRNFIFSSPQNEGKKIKRQGSYPKQKKRTKCKNCKNKKKKNKWMWKWKKWERENIARA